MDDLRLQAVAARVVAWHNRHPLARRIGVQQVRSVGYVALGVGMDGGVDADADAEGAVLPGAPNADQRSAAEPAPPADPPAPVEEDFTAAFAALAEHHGAESREGGPPGAAPGSTADADANADAIAVASGSELDVMADSEAADEVQAVEPGAEASAEDSDVATVLAPELSEPHEQPAPASAATVEAAVKPPPHIPTLRDRVLVRAQQPAVQGALLTVHEGYRPTLHPHAHAPSRAQPTAEHGEGDHLMAPLSPRDVARWVARHGRALLEAPVDGPVRRVTTPTVVGGPAAGTTYVMTAAIAGGGLTSRVLVGAGSPGAVLGTRLWSLPRVATAAALAVLLLTATAIAAAVWLQPAAQRADAVPAAASAGSAAAGGVAASAASESAASAAGAVEPAASNASATSAPEAAASAATEAAAAAEARPADVGAAAAGAAPHQHAAGVPADAPTHAPAGAALAVTTVKPVPAYAQKGAVGLPSRGLGLSDADKAAAREAVAAARAGRPAAPREAGVLPPAGEGQPVAAARTEPQAAPAPAAPSADVPADPSFAISTRALRTRAEAEQLQVAISALLRTPGAASRRVELLPEGDDWRVVAWPFRGQQEADRIRALLAGRGMKVEVLRF